MTPKKGKKGKKENHTHRRKWGKTKQEKGKTKKDILFVLLTCRVRSKAVRDFIQIAKFAKVHKMFASSFCNIIEVFSTFS